MRCGRGRAAQALAKKKEVPPGLAERTSPPSVDVVVAFGGVGGGCACAEAFCARWGRAA